MCPPKQCNLPRTNEAVQLGMSRHRLLLVLAMATLPTVVEPGRPRRLPQERLLRKRSQVPVLPPQQYRMRWRRPRSFFNRTKAGRLR